MLDTVWHLQAGGSSYSGQWADYVNKPDAKLEDMRRQIIIVDDIGYLLPDSWADRIFADSDQPGYWDYGATIGKIGGEQPVKGQIHNEMTVGQAENYAHEVGEKATARGIRLAAKNGYIPGARKIGRDWLIPYDGMNHYLDNRPKPGRKTDVR